MIVSVCSRSLVRLGEHDGRTIDDCQYINGLRTCAAVTQDFTIAEVVRHEDYADHRTLALHDIALIRMGGSIGTWIGNNMRTIWHHTG